MNIQANKSNNIRIVNSTTEDLSAIFRLFDQTMEFYGKNGYKVWNHIDKTLLAIEIENGRHYKILNMNEILGVFSVQFNDPFIWRDRDHNDAIYLHRIVVNPKFKGQKQFEKILNWAKQLAVQRDFKYIRIDTWADNNKLIDYYKSFGFEFIENFKTTNAIELPTQNRNLNVALLEMKLNENQKSD